MGQVESEVLKNQNRQLLRWLRYIDDVFCIWTHEQVQLEKLSMMLTNFILTLNLRMSTVEKCQIF